MDQPDAAVGHDLAPRVAARLEAGAVVAESHRDY